MSDPKALEAARGWLAHVSINDAAETEWFAAALEAYAAKAVADLEWQLGEVLKQRDADIAFSVEQAVADAVEAERAEQVRDCEWAASTWLRTSDDSIAIVRTVTDTLIERIHARGAK